MTISEQLRNLCNLSKHDCLIDLPPFLYHYTKEEHIRKILQDDCVTLKMTNINNFIDKQEGKVIEKFYQVALNSLKESHLIESNDWEELSRVKPDKDNHFLVYENGRKSLVRKKHDVYVFCFSKSKNDKLMFNNYSKSNSGTGYCIEFYPGPFKSLSTLGNTYQNISFSLANVLYGDNATFWLQNRILEIIKMTANFENPNTKWRVPIIQQILKELSYTTKNKEYEYEQEIRLTAYCPVDFDDELNTPYFLCERDKTCETDRFQISFTIPVFSCLFGGDPSNPERNMTLDFLSS